jgi:hypothetical protein
MDFGKIFDETMRKVLWFVGRFALQILDFAYNTLLSIFKLNVGDFPFIWNWFAGHIDPAVLLCPDQAQPDVFQDIL